MRPRRWIWALATVALAACGRTEKRERAASDQGGMPGMTMDSMRMDSMHQGMQGMQMMTMMRAHMDSMMRMAPERMRSMMPRHERMMSQMMDAMGADMRGMKMSADQRWNALTDSVKQDLAELPGLRGPELSSRMQAHAERVRRLIAAHEKMMGGR